MLKKIREIYELWRSIVVLLSIVMIGGVAFLLPLALPEFVIVSGPGGSGVYAELSPGTTFRQNIEIPENPANSLFIALEHSSEASRIQGHLISSTNSSPIDIGFGQPARIPVTEERSISGAWWPIPALEADVGHAIEISITDTARDPINIVADERSTDSQDATVLIDIADEKHRLPLALSTTHLRRQLRWPGLTSQDKQSTQQAALWAGLSVLFVIASILAVNALAKASRNTKQMVFLILGSCVLIGGIAARVWFARQLPLINDEQFYVYDAVLFSPSDPHFWKSPLLITGLRVWMSITGASSLLALRTLPILICAAALSLLAYTAYRLAGKVAGAATLVVGMLLPTVIPYTSLIMTEHMMLLPAIGAATLTISLRDRKKILWWQLLIVSVLVGVTTLARWSGIFWLIAIVLLFRIRAPREYARRVGWLILPYVAAFLAFIAIFPNILRGWRITEMFAEFFEQSSARGWLTKFAAWRVPFANITPLLVISAWGYSGGNRVRRIIYAMIVLVLILTIFPVLEIGSRLPTYPQYQQLAIFLPLTLLFLGFTFKPIYSRRALLDVAIFSIPPVISYIIFHKINAKYLAEFMPVFILMAGLGLGVIFQHIRQRKVAGGLAFFILILWLLPWVQQPIKHPYAGTLSVEAVTETVEYLKKNSRSDEKVLTGANLIPLLAQRDPANRISHPAWIAPMFRGRPDERFNQLFDPVADQLEAQQIPWVIDEKLTTDTYREHPRIDAILAEKYEVVKTIENDQSGPITILRPAL